MLSLLQEPEETEIHGKKKTLKIRISYRRSHKSIVLIVWEDDFDKIKTGESYKFDNVSTRHYKEMVKLTTTPDTTIAPIAHLQSLEEYENIGKIVGAFVEIDKKLELVLKLLLNLTLASMLQNVPNVASLR